MFATFCLVNLFGLAYTVIQALLGLQIVTFRVYVYFLFILFHRILQIKGVTEDFLKITGLSKLHPSLAKLCNHINILATEHYMPHLHNITIGETSLCAVNDVSHVTVYFAVVMASDLGG